MNKWLNDFQRADRALAWVLGIVSCVIFALAGLSLIIRSEQVSNQILGGFLLIVAVGAGYYFWRKLRGNRRGGHAGKTMTCPSCQLQFTIDEAQAGEPIHCPRCNRPLDA